jgi:hypothetical protein
LSLKISGVAATSFFCNAAASSEPDDVELVRPGWLQSTMQRRRDAVEFGPFLRAASQQATEQPPSRGECGLTAASELTPTDATNNSINSNLFIENLIVV